jgi:hypothetical protein
MSVAYRSADRFATAMASRLRIPSHALHPYPRFAPDCHDQEEGYVATPPENMRRDANIRHTASYLEPLKGGKVPVEILVRGKDADENKKQFQACLDTLKKAGKKVAVLKKDNSTGAFAEEWKASLQEAGFKEEDQVDLALILSNAALSVKDERELVSLLQALFFSTQS